MNVPRPPKGYLPRVTQPDQDVILLRLHSGADDAIYELSETEAALLYADLHAILMRRLTRLERALSQTADHFWTMTPGRG